MRQLGPCVGREPRLIRRKSSHTNKQIKIIHICCVCAYVWVCVSVYMCRGWLQVFFPYSSSPYFLRQGLSLDMEFAISASPAGQQVPRVCLSPLPITYISTTVPNVDTGDLNSGPHTCIASSLIIVSSQSFRTVKTIFFLVNRSLLFCFYSCRTRARTWRLLCVGQVL